MEKDILACIEKLLPKTHMLSQLLSRLANRKGVTHAFLIEGAPLNGQKYWARLLAYKTLVPSTLSDEAQAQRERLFFASSHPDLHYFPDDGKSFQIKSAKELIAKISQSPHDTEHVVVIENIERMTIDAANSLLKAIEEPTAPCKFFLTTQYKDGIIETLLSRTYHITVPQIDPISFRSYLSEEEVPLLLKIKELALRQLDLVLYLLFIVKKNEDAHTYIEQIEDTALHIEETLCSLDTTQSEKVKLLQELLIEQTSSKKKTHPFQEIFSLNELFFFTFERTIGIICRSHRSISLKQLSLLVDHLYQLREDLSKNYNKKLAIAHSIFR